MRLKEAIKEAEVFTDPYEHYDIKNWASDEYYKQMIDNLPPFQDYRQYSTKYENRYLYPMTSYFWKGVEAEFYRAFSARMRVQMCRDLPGYSIGPHTDGKKETHTYLFYLTPEEVEGAGTCVFVPDDRDFTCDGTKHHGFDGFTKIKQARYAPNRAFGFKRSDNSFHGVEPVDIERNLIQVSIWA